MSEELKVRTFRLSESVANRLKALCSEFDNQNSALDSIISAYEMQNAKVVLSDRQTEISDFDTHLQAIQKAFLYSLELNTNAEERVRAEFNSRLESQARLIEKLNDDILEKGNAYKCISEQLSDVIDANKDIIAELEQKVAILSEQNEKLQKSEQLYNLATERVEELKKQLTVLTEKSEHVDELKKQLADTEKKIDELQKELVDEKRQKKFAVSEAIANTRQEYLKQIEELQKDYVKSMTKKDESYEMLRKEYVELSKKAMRANIDFE